MVVRVSDEVPARVADTCLKINLFDLIPVD